MTNEQILKKAIEKAIKNGWKHQDIQEEDCSKLYIENKMVNCIIFSHYFAKAIWGEEIIETYGWDKGNHDDNRERELKFFCYTYKKPAWQYHLQQMVLKEEPLKYLEKFI